MLIDVITSSDNNEHCKTQISHHDFSFIFGEQCTGNTGRTTHISVFQLKFYFLITKIHPIIFLIKNLINFLEFLKNILQIDMVKRFVKCFKNSFEAVAAIL